MAQESDGRVALVTGASSGIGKAAAFALAQRGADVVCVDRQPGADTAALVEAAGRAALVLEADVSSEDAWQLVVEQAHGRFGRIDALVQAAGVFTWGTVLDEGLESWERLMAVNLRSQWLGMKHVLPKMLARRAGKVVNVASGAALWGIANAAGYTASKGGIVALTRQAALQYARHDIQVNALAPGFVDTPMWRDAVPDAAASDAAAASAPAGRLARPEEIAAAIVFLCDESCGYITGQTLVIDGGLSIGAPVLE